MGSAQPPAGAVEQVGSGRVNGDEQRVRAVAAVGIVSLDDEIFAGPGTGIKVTGGTQVLRDVNPQGEVSRTFSSFPEMLGPDPEGDLVALVDVAVGQRKAHFRAALVREGDG